MKKRTLNNLTKCLAVMIMVCLIATSITIPSFAKTTISATSNDYPASETSPQRVGIETSGSVMYIHVYDETMTNQNYVRICYGAVDFENNDFGMQTEGVYFTNHQCDFIIDITGAPEDKYYLGVEENTVDIYPDGSRHGYCRYCMYTEFTYENGEITFFSPNGEGEQRFLDEANANWDPADYLDQSLWSDFASNYDEIAQISKNLTINCRTDEQKVRVIHDWICNNISYYCGDDRDIWWDAEDIDWVFTNKIANYSGFANLFNAMLRSVGVPVMNIYGWNGVKANVNYSEYQISGEWNLVYYNNKWRIFDLSDNCQKWYYGQGDSCNNQDPYIEAPLYTYYDASPFVFGAEKISFGQTFDEGEHPVQSIGVFPMYPIVNVGDTFAVEALFYPENATNKNVTWESDNPSVATVDSYGKVTAISPGWAIITGTSEDGGYSACSYVTVEGESQEWQPEESEEPDEPVEPDEPGYNGSSRVMYRLFNPNTGEHFYTSDENEKDHLSYIGWDYEGMGWTAPDDGIPIYRLYNPFTGDHHYTMDEFETDSLIDDGWDYEGIGWYSVGFGTPLYRLFNPNEMGVGSHHYTSDINEREYLIENGWNDEGIAWYGL